MQTTPNNPSEDMQAEKLVSEINGAEIPGGALGNDDVPLEPMRFGQTRWVQAAFLGLFGIFAWLFDKIITSIWVELGSPNTTVIQASSLILGAATAWFLYNNAKSKGYADDVAAELAQVSWPTKEETWAHTWVVIATAAIAAVVVSLMDNLWNHVTNWIYQ